jgi:predicted negative regulator of RcsB-dependent stress response
MTRHELKEQDEITTSLQKFTEVAYSRKKEIITAVVAVVVLIGVLVGWRVYSANRNANAQSQLGQTISAFTDPNLKSDKERFEKTLVEAKKTHDAYGSLTAGAIALYYMGLSHEGLGDTAKATEALQQAIQSGDANVAGVSRFALASIYKRHGDYAKSAAVFELAKLSETANKIDDAKSYYQKIVSEFPESPFRQEADQALKRLGVPATEQKPS